MKNNPFTRARKVKNLTFTQAANRMRGVSEQQLRNLEGIGATRNTDPAHVRIETALEIIKVFWPEIDHNDFVPETPFSCRPRDSAARRRLKGYAEV
jgi:hypothetical protein